VPASSELVARNKVVAGGDAKGSCDWSQPPALQWVAERFPSTDSAWGRAQARPTPIGGRLSGQAASISNRGGQRASLNGLKRPMVAGAAGQGNSRPSGGIRERFGSKLKGPLEPLEGGLVSYTTSGTDQWSSSRQLRSPAANWRCSSPTGGEAGPLTQGSKSAARGRAEALGTVPD